jgi:hypothetical protein
MLGVTVFVDTFVVVAGLRSQLGASNRVLTLVAELRLVPLVTTALFLEYEDVLSRPEQRLARHGEGRRVGFFGGTGERRGAGQCSLYVAATTVSRFQPRPLTGRFSA